MNARLLLLAQLLGTLVILAFMPSNLAKSLALLAWWSLTFRKISKRELLLYFVACAFFTFMNAMSLKQGIFTFTRPDVLGMPYYELFMWGFYLLHALRMVGGHIPERPGLKAWALALGFAIAFGTISDQTLLLIITSVLLLAGLALFHEPFDFAYTGYMVFLGAAIEYTGVFSGEWYYPGDPWGGVPLWFITLWGGVGLLLRRLVLPILASDKRQNLNPHY